MSKKYLFLLVCLFISGCIEEQECSYDSDCASWQECSGNMCLDTPEGACQYNFQCASGQECVSGTCQSAPERPKNPSGTEVTSCSCEETTSYPGNTRSHSRCESGRAVFLLCYGCCRTDIFGNCSGFPWNEVCQ